MSDEGTVYSYVKAHCGEEHKIIDRPAFAYVDKWAAVQPDKEVYVFRPSDEERDAITYGELAPATERLAIWFKRQFHVTKGDHVGILSLNRMAFVLCDLALSRLGVVVVRLYATMDSKVELTRILSVTNCRLLLVQPGSMPSIHAVVPSLTSHDSSTGTRLVSSQLPKLEHVVVLSGDQEYPGTILLPHYGSINVSDGEVEELRAIQATITLDDNCTLYSTSGSTGIPSFVMLSQEAALQFPNQCLIRCGFTEEDRFYCDRPIAHIGGNPRLALPFGGALIIADTQKTVAGQDGSFLLRVLRDERVTCGVTFPYALYDIVTTSKDENDFKDMHIKYLIFGGQMTNIEVISAVKKTLNVPLVNLYGTTEIGDIMCTALSDPLQVVSKYSGHVLPGVEVKIVDRHTGEILPRGQVGALALRKSVRWRYWDDEEKMKARHDADGYFYPGDMARMEESGMLEIVGREDDMMSVGTVKVYPASIEKKICQHPAVDKAIVFGVPDARLYEVIGAAILAKPGYDVTSSEIMASFHDSVSKEDLMSGSSMAPKFVWILESFPKTSSGKIDKKRLKQHCIEELNQQ